jgi:hypothetical protein
MKEIKPDELFANLTFFLKDRGIELTEGAYSQRIRKGCDLLADAVNLTQAGLARAKAEIDEKLDRMRQIIHEKTAPHEPEMETKRPRRPAASPPGASSRKRGQPARRSAATVPRRKKTA